VQKDVLLYKDYFAYGKNNGNSISLEAPASVSLIYNVFIEYEKTFGTL
jgi:hypothetical protein